MGGITYLNLNRFTVGYHGTDRKTAERLVAGHPFDDSVSEDEWLGHGAYFWEFGPQKAWWWAKRRMKKIGKPEKEAALVGALIQLGTCFDLLDPPTQRFAVDCYMKVSQNKTLRNLRQFKMLDCAVFNQVYKNAADVNKVIDTSRALFAPSTTARSQRLWPTSGVLRETHIQICVRNPECIMSVWPVRSDGRYGIEDCK